MKKALEHPLTDKKRVTITGHHEKFENAACQGTVASVGTGKRRCREMEFVYRTVNNICRYEISLFRDTEPIWARQRRGSSQWRMKLLWMLLKSNVPLCAADKTAIHEIGVLRRPA